MTSRLHNAVIGLFVVFLVTVLEVLVLWAGLSMLPEWLHPIWWIAWLVWMICVIRPYWVAFNSKHYPVSRQNFEARKQSMQEGKE